MARTHKKKLRGGNNTKTRNNSTNFPPKSINDHIDHVIYINLAHRTDRKSSIEKVLSIFNQGKVTRLEAHKHNRGHVGCSKSHVAALEMAIQKGWKNVLIVEDDMDWNKVEKSYPVFERLVAQPYDVIMLGSTYPRYDKDSLKLHFAYSMVAYLVNKNYYQTLLNNFKEGSALLEKNPDTCSENCVDAHIKALVEKDAWYVVIPSLCYQRADHSNIAGGRVNYRGVSALGGRRRRRFRKN